MLYNFIRDEHRDYFNKMERLQNMLSDQRNSLVEYSKRDNAKQGYLNKVNYQMRISHEFMNSASNLIQQMIYVMSEFGEIEQPDIKQLKSENKRLLTEINNLKSIFDLDNMDISKINNYVSRLNSDRSHFTRSKSIQKAKEDFPHLY